MIALSRWEKLYPRIAAAESRLCAACRPADAARVWNAWMQWCESRREDPLSWQEREPFPAPDTLDPCRPYPGAPGSV